MFFNLHYNQHSSSISIVLVLFTSFFFGTICGLPKPPIDVHCLTNLCVQGPESYEVQTESFNGVASVPFDYQTVVQLAKHKPNSSLISGTCISPLDVDVANMFPNIPDIPIEGLAFATFPIIQQGHILDIFYQDIEQVPLLMSNVSAIFLGVSMPSGCCSISADIVALRFPSHYDELEMTTPEDLISIAISRNGMIRVIKSCDHGLPGQYTWQLSLDFKPFNGSSYQTLSFLFQSQCIADNGLGQVSSPNHSPNIPSRAKPTVYWLISLLSLLLFIWSLQKMRALKYHNKQNKEYITSSAYFVILPWSMAGMIGSCWLGVQASLSVAPFPDSDDSGHWGIGIPVIVYSQLALGSYILKFQYDKNVNQSGKTGQITGEHPALPIRKDSIELASLPTTDSASSTFKNEQAIIRERGERNHSKTGAIEHEHKHSSVPISTYWAWILRLHNHQDGLDMAFMCVVGIPNLWHVLNDQSHGHEMFHSLMAVMICQVGLYKLICSFYSYVHFAPTEGLEIFLVLMINGMLFYGHPQHSMLSQSMHNIGALLCICWAFAHLATRHYPQVLPLRVFFSQFYALCFMLSSYRVTSQLALDGYMGAFVAGKIGNFCLFTIILPILVINFTLSSSNPSNSICACRSSRPMKAYSPLTTTDPEDDYDAILVDT